MKTITGKMLISLVGLAVATPFFLIALVAGARAIELAQNAQDETLLVMLAFSGAVISMINGFGRRTGKAQRKGISAEARVNQEAPSGEASAVNLSF
jgi:hypothetical protein